MKIVTEHAPRVSVIIPCYNREKFIKETIKSVLNQTYPNIEIITVDDGSTDNTRSILNSFGKKITVIEHPGRINKGQSAAINIGMRNATGQYIAILDSDDFFLPEKIEKQVQFLEKHSQFGLVYSNGYAVDVNGEKLYRVYDEHHEEKSDPERVLIDCYLFIPTNALVRKSAFQLAGDFDENLRAAQDHDMAIRLFEIVKIAYIKDYLFSYRRHKDTISSKKADLRWKNGLKILKKASKRYNYSLKAKRKRFAVLNFRLGQCYLESRFYFNAVYHFIIAGAFDPIRSIRVILQKEATSGYRGPQK